MSEKFQLKGGICEPSSDILHYMNLCPHLKRNI